MDRGSTNQKVEGDGKKAEPDGGDLGEIQRPRARGLRRIISVTTEKPIVFHQHPQPKAGPSDQEQAESKFDEEDHGGVNPKSEVE